MASVRQNARDESTGIVTDPILPWVQYVFHGCFFDDMKRFFVALTVSLSAAGCAHMNAGTASDTPVAPAQADESIELFSNNPAGGLPSRWEKMILLHNKKRTQYQLVSEQGKTILHARAAGASSGLMEKVNIDPFQQPWLNWKWKIGSLIETADNYDRSVEDSPARIILGFDGDKDALPFTDQILFETAKIVTGHDFPYATLMYIWENKAPVGTVIANSRSGRIKMIVAASGPNGVGEWRNFGRNIIEDFELAFGEKPGKLIGVGVLTDTDNTGETVEAWYGDIRLTRH